MYAISLFATELLSKAAVVALVLPIAAAVVQGLEQPRCFFATAVQFAASQSFLLPIGYQTNLMAYASGRYRFLDFF
jgi:di/tricarboxylate transporter